MNHTPEPWIIYQPSGGVIQIKSGATVIARVADDDHQEGHANARLIAAAPELLGACRSALRALGDNLRPGPMDADAKAGLLAAIAKTTTQ